MISYIYYIYFIKRNHFGRILQGILRPATSGRQILSLYTYIGILMLLPFILHFIVKSLNLFPTPSSLLLNIVKLVTLVDASILLVVGVFSLMLFPLLYLFIKFPSENSSDKTSSGDDLIKNQKDIEQIDSDTETKNRSIETANQNIDILKEKTTSLEKKKAAIKDGTFEFSSPIETVEMK